METKWIKFNALGSEIVILANLEVGQEYLLDQAKRSVQEFENNFSRFIKGNELDRFNTSENEKFLASNLFVEIIREALTLHSLTDGIFDPTIIGSLESVGYDRNFSEIASSGINGLQLETIQQTFTKRPRFDLIQIDGNEIVKPKGLRIDLGGIGKGFLSDYLSDHIFKHTEDFWVSLGGDLVTKGHEKQLERKGWKVGVQDPHENEKESFAIKTKGEKLGIATSGVFKRKGITGDFAWNHIIDPRTGLPVNNEIMAATVIASSAKKADVLAKTVIILGQEKGLELIDSEADAAAILFFKHGGTAFSKRAPQYL